MSDICVVGIDPGLITSGYGVIQAGETIRLIEAGTIRPPDRKAPLEQRLAAIFADMATLLEETKPAWIAVEDLYTRYERPQSAILLGHARGVILLAAARAGVPVRSFAANTVKRALTGEGRADKAEMQLAVTSILGLKTVPKPADVADALAIALTCVYSLRAPEGVRL